MIEKLSEALEILFPDFVYNDKLTVVLVFSLFALLYFVFSHLIAKAFNTQPRGHSLAYILWFVLVIFVFIQDLDLFKVENNTIFGESKNYNGYFVLQDEENIIDLFGEYAVYNSTIKRYEINVGLNGYTLFNEELPLFIFTQPYVVASNTSDIILYSISLYKISTTGALQGRVTTSNTALITNVLLNTNDVFLYIYGVSNYA